MQVLGMTHCLIIVTICGKYLQNPLIFEKVMDQTQNIPCNRLCESLTSKCDRLLRMTHRLIIVINCGKYLQNPFKNNKVMDRTRHIPSNRQC
jgi:hypothetical protein